MGNIAESTVQKIRQMLSMAWIVLIFSLFYDPLGPFLTDPKHLASPWHIPTHTCVHVQGQCLYQHPYGVGPALFWSVVLPAIILLLLVFGHEVWRRICPLAFVMQIPRSLGLGRRITVTNPTTGQQQKKLALVDQNSWLGRNHTYIQFGLLYLGLCLRLLLLNADRLALGIFLGLTIVVALGIGYWYGGKSWCQYFCPMAPVELIYSQPRALFASTAHQGERQKITQSMCRQVDPNGQIQSACVGCKTTCMDIDLERSYWKNLQQPDSRLLYYGYLGLLLGFYGYYWLYAGDWNYLYSGIWNHESDLAKKMLSPGFYLFGWVIPIPKVIAVPLTLAVSVALTYTLGIRVEKHCQQWLTADVVRHRMYAAVSFICANLLFCVFGPRLGVAVAGFNLQYLFNWAVAIISGILLRRAWNRTSLHYEQERLATSLRRQLAKLNIDLGPFLEGRSLEDLRAEEIYVLAKVLPSFNHQQKLQIYRGMLQETFEEGKLALPQALVMIEDLRCQLQISTAEHERMLQSLGRFSRVN